jgi:DNA polymerase III subunit gamma/tau
LAYLVLARKYRPQTFADVVRQEHVTRTLTNAIRSERVAHAILFAGPRGTGKTTIARILAKAMNCETGPTPTPCGRCRSCEEIVAGHASDVLEIDGASNNGVDHIRDLRENIRYMPAHSRYKIYIIDEVHMLSTAAFNALLKTLEEPPAHVMFLFATTEAHKIPITILSRCQRHDLRRIETADVIRHMGELCRREGIAMAPESLSLIAREAGGSMRDALSLLDHVMACAEGEAGHRQVLDILGVVDRDAIFRLADAALTRDIPAALGLIDEVYDHGHNLKELYAALLEHFRNLLVVRMGGDGTGLVDAPDHELRRMAETVRNVSEAHLVQLLEALFREESAVRFSAQPRIAMEMAFFRMFRIRPALPIETLIDKLDALSRGVLTEEELARPDPLDAPMPTRISGAVAGENASPDRTAGGSASGSGLISPAAPAEDARRARAEISPPESGGAVRENTETPEGTEARPVAGYAPAEDGSGVAGVRETPPAPEPIAATPAPAPVGESDASGPSETLGPSVESPLSAPGDAPGPNSKTESATSPAKEASRVSGPTDFSARKPADGPETPAETPEAEAANPTADAVAVSEPPDIDPGESGASGASGKPEDDSAETASGADDLDDLWERFTRRVRKKTPMLASCLDRCRIVSLDGDAVTLEVGGPDFNLKRIEKQQRTLQGIFAEVLGRPVQLIPKKGEGGGPAPNRAAENHRRRDEAVNHPLVAAAMEIFEGSLVDVKPLSEE